ncbi:MAG TPA: hypothetical protein VEQ63_00555 [Bryobacteraceae bacterium]|nr:hypothetical protein [Bryobacteraceae bacterium]
MRVVILVVCLLASSIQVYPESGSTASRTTELPTISAASSNTPLVTEEQVKEWVKRWQKRLGLADWKIEAKIVRLYQLPKGTIANIHWSLPRKVATIKVLDSVDSNLRKEDIARDTELSVVHELVHLSMAKLPLDSANTDLEEEAVKKLSIALVALDKGDNLQQ